MNNVIILKSGQPVEVFMQDEVSLDIDCSLRYIKSGEQELKDYVENTAKPDINNYIKTEAEPVVSGIIKILAEPTVNVYLEETVKPEINEYAEDKKVQIQELVTRVSNLRDETQNAAIEASAAAETAETSENNALVSATGAGVSESNALTYAQNALASAERAEQIARNISNGFDLLDHKFSDHILNDLQWLRGDTFSWQDGTVYSTAYNKLLEEYNSSENTETENGINFKLTANGFKIADADQENTISELYNSTGIAWYYILDTENQRFKLPRITYQYYKDVAPVVGNGLTLGITNGSQNAGICVGGLQGTQPVFTDRNNFGNPVGTTLTSTYLTGSTSVGITTDPDNSGVEAHLINDTSLTMYLYFYVGNFTQSAVEQTAGLSTELFNAKADVNLSNANPSQAFREMSIRWIMPDYSAGINILADLRTSTGFIAPSDGFINFTDFTTNELRIEVNGNVITGKDSSYNTLPINADFFVARGDVVKVTNNTGNAYATTFFPLKGVTANA